MMLIVIIQKLSYLEKQKEYNVAAEAFSQAPSVYQPRGKYKDSDKRVYDNGKNTLL